jgi:hypothetical protein
VSPRFWFEFVPDVPSRVWLPLGHACREKEVVMSSRTRRMLAASSRFVLVVLGLLLGGIGPGIVLAWMRGGSALVSDLWSRPGPPEYLLILIVGGSFGAATGLWVWSRLMIRLRVLTPEETLKMMRR